MKAVKITNLCKKYRVGNIEQDALKNVNLEIEQGDFFALLGLNGAGKSTLIGCLTSLVQKTSGKIQFFDVDLDLEKELAKSFIGVVPQEFNLNIFEPVEYIVCNQAGYYGISKKEALKRSEGLLKELELWDKRRTPSGFLSGGMKRRLMIARALIHKPKILVLDEPTAGVDIELRKSLWVFLQKMNQSENITTILTTHYLEEAESTCNKIAIISQGKIIQNTHMKDFLSKVKSQVLIIDFEHTLKDDFKLDDFSFEKKTDNSIKIIVESNQSLNLLFEKLNSQNLQVKTLKNVSNKLEELFLRFVER